MEIAATGLPGLGAMTNVAAAPEGGDAFAAALGAVGMQETAAQAVAQDGTPALVLPTAPTTAQAPLLTSAAVAPPAPEEPAPEAMATEAVALVPSEPLVDTAAVETPMPKEQTTAAPRARGGKAAAKAPQAPAEGVPAATVAAKPAEVAEPTKVAKADDQVTTDIVVMELAPEQADDGSATPLADASLTPTVPVPHDANKVHSAAPQPGKADDSALHAVEPRTSKGTHPAPAEAVASTGGEGNAEPVAESFAQQVSTQTADRPQSQPGAAAPLPGQTPPAAAQPSGPAVAAAAQHPTLSFRADKVAREMGLEIARHVTAGGGDELVIRLDPAELGRINIRMSVNEHGQLRAVVAADAPAVIDAIRNDIPELSRALEQAGVRTDGQSFRFDRGGSDTGGQWQQRYQQQQAGTRANSGSFAGLQDEPAYRPLATNGRINMMA